MKNLNWNKEESETHKHENSFGTFWNVKFVKFFRSKLEEQN
jgi:hypothetical protein